jgi:hypothetical protein
MSWDHTRGDARSHQTGLVRIAYGRKIGAEYRRELRKKRTSAPALAHGAKQNRIRLLSGVDAWRKTLRLSFENRIDQERMTALSFGNQGNAIDARGGMLDGAVWKVVVFTKVDLEKKTIE